MTDLEHAHTDEAPHTRPVVRLRPKGGRRFAEGAPWVYADELVLDRRAKARPPGVVATLEDADRRPLAAVAFNPASTIAARLLDRDPGATVDAAWFAARLKRALALRETLHDAPFYRLIHAEADDLPGLVIDRFGDALAVQPNAAWVDRLLPDLLAALDATLAPATVVINAGSRARALEGLGAETRVARGALDGPIPTPMNGATYLADLLGGQKTGLFFDQRPNHAFAARLGRGRAVLDVFTHVGGFALAALAAGAESALAVDSSEPALDLARRGAALGGVADRFQTLKSDAFAALRGFAEEQRRFGLVICDPPAFAPQKAALDAGLRAYAKTARLAAALVEPDGFLALCSCSHAVDAAAFRAACAQGIAAAGRAAALIHSGGAGPDHPVHAALPETGYLKATFWRLS
ncbi:MAG: class I SAM-dependent rRNA methyltransferase [Rhodobacteraceae bacterium]|nr:MAG: class I SAM-dependent rRNA methyltransferase [Paracoccaceae bacterium]